MNPLFILLAAPLLGTVVLALVGDRRAAPWIHVAFAALTFAAACGVAAVVLQRGALRAWGGQFDVEAFNAWLVVLTAFIGLSTAWYSGPYMRVEVERGRLDGVRLRLYHSMAQLFMATMLVALTTDNMGLMWVAMEAATLSTVLLVALYRTRAGLEAAWKYFILCGVGIALALFGTVLLYLAAERALGGAGLDALLWTRLDAVRARMEPEIVAIAFVFLLVGYGTKVGLVPLHSWLPDAHAEGPTPVSAVLSGLLLNVALFAVLRARRLVEGSLHAAWPSTMLMVFGLLSVLVAGFMLWRQRDVKRMFAWSSIEHMGLATFAFGLGGPAASFAGLLHLTGHALTKSAIFFSVGHATQKAGSQRIEDIQGLREVSPLQGWILMLGTLAIVGLPPFSVFASELLILLAALSRHPWTVVPLLLALGLAFGAIVLRVQGMVFGPSTLRRLPQRPTVGPAFVHLALVLLLGLAMPAVVTDWWRAAAGLIMGGWS